MVARVARIGERITHQVEGNGNQRYDGRGENQQVRIIQEIAAGVAQQDAQRGRGDIQQAQVGQRGFIGDDARNGQRQAQDDGEDPHIKAAVNYINNGYYQEALNVLSSISNRDAKWYYLSAMANSGAGNNVKAQEHINEAVRLEPDNMQYQRMKQQLEQGGTWYQQQSSPYGRPVFSGGDWCMKLCILNLFCNCCCNGGMCCGAPTGYYR